MLDTQTLRVALVVLALTLLVLFYFGSYRGTRSAYTAWWCAALALLAIGRVGFLIDVAGSQVWASPVASVVVVAGAACIWAAARSLRGKPTAWWRLAVAPAVVAGEFAVDASVFGRELDGAVFLGAMAALFGLAELELLQQILDRRRPRDRGTWLALGTITLGGGLAAGYYVSRWIAYLVDGADPRFNTYFGGSATILVSIVLLATVTFSMDRLSIAQRTADLSARASRDGLTGVLNRTEFLRLADQEVRRMGRRRETGQLIFADLDHFKRINDDYGHQVGDQVIQLFAQACRSAVRSTDLVGRYGGEEFLLLLSGATPERATEVTAAIDAVLEAAPFTAGIPLPTASYGIAVVDGGDDLIRSIGHADAALYLAKASGRHRAVHHEPRTGRT